MIALYATSTGVLVSVGSVVADPLPAGLTALDLGDDNRLLDGSGRWDVPTRSVITISPSPATLAANAAALMNTASLQGRLTRLAAYKTDADVVAALARGNTTAATTQERNRLDKVILRRQARQDAAIAALIRLLDPSLLASLTDTVDS